MSSEELFEIPDTRFFLQTGCPSGHRAV